MRIEEEDYIAHYGTPRHSGRYPWGSGGEPSRNKSFLDTVDDLRKQGLTETEIARGLNLSTTELRARKSIEKNAQTQDKRNTATRLRDKGMSNVAIGRQMGIPESSVRALLDHGAKDKEDVLVTTSNMLRDEVKNKKYVDVGTGVEKYVGISQEKLNTAVTILKQEGYVVHPVKIKQVGTGLDTEYKILAAPGTTQREVWENRFQIQQIGSWSDSGGRSFNKIHDPVSISSSRVGINYKEDGGDKADGVIYVRPGVEDVSLGNARYAQVRVKVDDGHYLKGMAMYKHDLPEGIDLQFNTTKSDTGNKLDALKPLETDPQLPFGSTIRRQILKDRGTDKERPSSVMNLVNEEGDWGEWSRNLSTQFLSKQSPSLAKEQLDLTFSRRKNEFDDIKNLTNPTVKKKLLEGFADEADSAAVHLQAASLPRSNWHAILPVNSLPPTQIYAPQYNNGDRVVLIRYPHGGTFEIPELTVNNRHQESKKLLGDNPLDAVGIHHSVATKLSGADFDGDTVLVIPNQTGKVKSSPALDVLKTFDPRHSYPAYDGMKTMDGGIYNAKTKEVDYTKPPSSRIKGIEMGIVSNLITDMTLKGASHEQISRAVRHSMVVIDAEKHHLNWKQSEKDLGIAQLKKEYQSSARGGASTLISRKKSEIRVPAFKPRPHSEGGPIDRVTGRKVFVETGATTKGPDGSRIPKIVKVNKLSITEDAHTLSSGTRIEKLYADHSNRLKNLANEARLEVLKTPALKYSSSAKEKYSNEVKSLNAKLALAIRNRPLERQAQVIANAEIRAKKDANPNLDKDALKKISFTALENARIRTGAKKQEIEIEEKEWDAIQAGAISDHRLQEILKKANLETVRKLAAPPTAHLMTSSKTNRAKALLALGYTRAEVAADLGVSVSTLDTAITG